MTAAASPGARRVAAVGGQPVPHKGRLLPAKEAAQLVQGLDERVGVVGDWLVVEGQLRAATAGAVAQRGGHGGALPLEVVADDGVRPRGAQVRRVTGNSEAPDSSQNTMAARRRRALRRML